ncbi:hypothetical protein IMCC3317_01100 [Kordia antarctica]|uniref:Uncharacterized protein n=1 Tax=Kordia antarctica TaxID=1218801 RepID=A0A7L4ZEV7_9FLAO|nr:hypothetical protein [Kordia antarctica]QHI34766.1 hypothetical protein IMCC3317_01100 [Kordia antarctica]
MKKITILFVLCSFTTLFLACGSSSTIKEPDAIGKYAFKILKDIQTTSKQEFLTKLLTIETLREAVKKEENGFSERAKNEITRMTKEDYNSRIERDYNQLKKQAIKYNIVWNKIKYIDYTFKIKEKNGDKSTDGTLYFSHNSQTYVVSVSTVNIGEGYSIIELERLKKNTGERNY